MFPRSAMDDSVVVNTFANRDAPIPVLVPGAADGASDDEGSSRVEHGQVNTDGVADAAEAANGPAEGKGHRRTTSLQDRLLTKYVLSSRCAIRDCLRGAHHYVGFLLSCLL